MPPKVQGSSIESVNRLGPYSNKNMRNNKGNNNDDSNNINSEHKKNLNHSNVSTVVLLSLHQSRYTPL